MVSEVNLDLYLKLRQTHCLCFFLHLVFVSLCVDVMTVPNAVVLDVLAGGAGSAVTFDAGSGSAGPGGGSFPSLGSETSSEILWTTCQKHTVERFTVAVVWCHGLSDIHSNSKPGNRELNSVFNQFY